MINYHKLNVNDNNNGFNWEMNIIYAMVVTLDFRRLKK